MRRALTLGLVLLATAASATDLSPSREDPSQKTQWASSGSFSALQLVRAVAQDLAIETKAAKQLARVEKLEKFMAEQEARNVAAAKRAAFGGPDAMVIAKPKGRVGTRANPKETWVDREAHPGSVAHLDDAVATGQKGTHCAALSRATARCSGLEAKMFSS